MTYTDEQIARVAHEANRALQLAQDHEGIPVAVSWPQFPRGPAGGTG